ncbi:hypothetical protein [Reyranella sp.]|uniref:hypothetical protein n=1 Tax=Reyranella sp. TaxID=1929291 RepID=UPI003BAA0E74
MEHRSVRLHAIALLVTWLAGTVVVLIASAAAPIAVADLDLLRANAGWYAAGYGLFFLADGAIALLGVSVVTATEPDGRFRGPAIIVLFALSGTLGVLADVRMVAAAQLLAVGSPVLAPANAAGFLSELNATCNWLSTASFLPAALATWLAARTAHAGPGWVVFTRFSALYQLATGILSAAAFFTSEAALTDLALAAAVVGLPVFAAVWLIWMLRDMHIRVHKENIA